MVHAARGPGRIITPLRIKKARERERERISLNTFQDVPSGGRHEEFRSLIYSWSGPSTRSIGSVHGCFVLIALPSNGG